MIAENNENPKGPPVATPRPCKVCHVAATTEGATWMLEQLRELRARFGYEVTAIVGMGDGKLLRRLEAAEIAYHQFDFSFNPSNQLSLLRQVWMLAKFLRQQRYDVVQTHLFNSMVICRLAAWLADVPVSLTMIAGPYHLEAHTPYWIDISTWWMQTGLIASCEYTRQIYQKAGVPQSRLHLAYYGPDESRFNPHETPAASIRKDFGWPENTPLIGMIAYFYPVQSPSSWTPPKLQGRANKRQQDLVAATPLLLKEFPQARVILVGSGWGAAGEELAAKVQKQIQELGLDEHVKLLGYRSDVTEILKSLDVSVQASISENLGGTIEALLMACPTVATRTGGLVDSVLHDRTGVIVEPCDPPALAEGILTLLRAPARAKDLGIAGRQWMLERFTLQRTVTDLHAIYAASHGERRGYAILTSLWRMLITPFIFTYLAFRLNRDIRPRPKFAVKPTGDWLRNIRTKLAGMSPPRLCGRLVRCGHFCLLTFYGNIRALLAGTAALKKWDILFARIRGRKPPL